MRAMRLLAGGALLALTACGGGDGGNAPAPIPAPAPAPAPVPAPPPGPTNYNTAEYQASNAAQQAGAIAAYNAGASGQGVTIAFIDSGIDQSSAQFAGRISPASQDLVSGRGIQDPDGHGTSVAAVAAAARDNAVIEGVAPQATLLVLRGETQGSCPKCSFSDPVITRGIDIAVANHARVINISLGGGAAGTELTAAIARATAAGVVVVIAAGNESGANPDPFAQAGINPAVGNGAYIIAGAVDANNQLATFTNRAGTGQNIYLAALGVGVLSIGTQGQQFLFDGTSYATPTVSGAAALLAGAFPNLTGQQIVDLLLTSATDAGAPGTDDQFGRGILNIAGAFAPKGTTSLPGTAVPVSLATNASVGGALGSAPKLGAALSGAIVLDGYGRAYRTNLGHTLVPAPRSGLAGALLGASQTASLGTPTHRLSLTIDPGQHAAPWLGFGQRGLDARGQGGAPRVGLVSSTLWTGADLDAGFGLRLDALGDGGHPAFFAASGDSLETAVALRQAGAVSARQRVGAWTFLVGADSVRAFAPLHALAGVTATEWRFGVARQLGGVRLAADWSERGETGGLLGTTLAPAFGIAGARTRTLGLTADAPLGRWRASLGLRHGWTNATLAPGLIDRVNDLRSLGWRLDLARDGLFTRGDNFAVRLAQPMRVVDGLARLRVPDAYDYATRTAHYAERLASLAPDGTERAVEAVYSRAFGLGRAGGHLFYRADAEHVAGLNDAGAALTLSAEF